MGNLTTSAKLRDRPAFQLPPLRLPEPPSFAAAPRHRPVRPEAPVRPTAPPAPVAPTEPPATEPAPSLGAVRFTVPTPSTAAATRAASLRGNATLGLTLAIAAFALLACIALALWLMLHGDPPGMH